MTRPGSDGNTWGSPTSIFGASPASGKGTIYYDPRTLALYVVATQNLGRGSPGNSPTPNNVWISSA